VLLGKKGMSKIPLLVVSCDRYADLWAPFFTLFWKRWPDCPYPVYLGTNFKTYPDERVTTIRIADDFSWSSGVRRMLERLGAEYVILFLEDFLIRRRVNTPKIERLVRIAQQRQLGCLRLAAQLPLAFAPSHRLKDYPDLGVIAPGETLRVSAQAAIWRTETLERLLIPCMSAWEFEEIGTQMSEFMPDLFWATYEPAIVYDQAVEKGKWKPGDLRICQAAGVEVDLGARAVFSHEELCNHYRASESRYRSYEAKRKAISHFRAGGRLTGLRYSLQFLRQYPLSAQAWAVLLFGLLGSSGITWLQRQYVRLKVARVGRRQLEKMAVAQGRNPQADVSGLRYPEPGE